MNMNIRTVVHIKCLVKPVEFTTEIIIEDSKITIQDLNATINKNYIPHKGDKIFFIPGCDVPRFKVKQFCENFGVSLVKYKEKANVKFAGSLSFRQLVTNISGYYYSKETLLNYLIQTVGAVDDYKSLINSIKDSSSDYIIASYTVVDELKKALLGKVFNSKSFPYDEVPKLMFVNEATYQAYLNLENDSQIYSQNEILRRINTGGVMGDEQYVSIQRMLKSSDVENVKLAMEAMANSDYEKSCVPLLLLIKEYGEKLQNSPTRNHVNFKSLLKFFEIEDINNFDLDDIIKSLLKRKLLNKTNLDRLMPMAMEQMNSDAQTEYFTVDKVGIEESVQIGLTENILDENCDTEVVEDFQEQINPRLN